jgi:hypothetical protein
MERSSITRIWLGLADESVHRLAGDAHHVEAPEVQDALDHAVERILEYLRGHGLEAQPGHDGGLRTLDFKTEADCLDAHERLVAASDGRLKVKVRFVLRPSGVTILVVT